MEKTRYRSQWVVHRRMANFFLGDIDMDIKSADIVRQVRPVSEATGHHLRLLIHQSGKENAGSERGMTLLPMLDLSLFRPQYPSNANASTT